MKTIRNKTHMPLRIRLPGGKVLHLGPAKTGQISDQAANDPSIKRLVKKKQIEIVGEAAHPDTPAAGAGGAGPEATHGHPQPSVVRPKGDR